MLDLASTLGASDVSVGLCDADSAEWGEEREERPPPASDLGDDPTE